MNQKNSTRYGSLILLKPEFEERYIILHRHTFPGVLNRLYESHIRNFSIFLRDSMLFSYFDYVGDNYSEDMDRIARDATTRDWWKLTDPMQDPLKSREKGEWWARMPEVYHTETEKEADSSSAVRFAYAAAVPSQPMLSNQAEGFSQAGIDKLTLFYKDKKLYAYGEQFRDTDLNTKRQTREKIMSQILSSAAPEAGCSDWHPMSEVFHTGSADIRS